MPEYKHGLGPPADRRCDGEMMVLTLEWIQNNYANVLQILILLVTAGEMITRLTPTKTDDGFIKRIGAQLDRVLTVLKVPNLRKKVIESSRVDNPDNPPWEGSSGPSN